MTSSNGAKARYEAEATPKNFSLGLSVLCRMRAFLERDGVLVSLGSRAFDLLSVC